MIEISDSKTNIIAASLLVLMFFIAVFSLKDDSVTVDEVHHIPAGYSYLTKGEYRLNPEHPPLIKDLAAISLLFLNLNSFQEKYSAQIAGWDFLYHVGNNPDKILFLARLPMIFVLIFLGWFLFKWTRELAGNFPALLVLFLFSFSPDFIAHGRLVTFDVGTTLSMVLAFYFFLKFLEKPNKKNTIIFSLFFGIALVVKFFNVLLIPFFGIIFLLFIFLNSKKTALKDYIKRAPLIILITLSLVWIVYELHFINYPKEQQLADIESGLRFFNNTVFFNNIAIWLSQNSILRPFGHYLYGFTIIYAKLITVYGWPNYILGTISNQSFWYYYLVAYLIKIPLAFHILTLVVFLAVIRFLREINLKQWLKNHFTELSMLIFILIYWVIASRSKAQVGIRYLIPTFPFLYILVSFGVKSWIEKIKTINLKKIAIFSVLALLFWYGISSLSSFPYYLSYFNELVGGSKKGYEYIVDSNVDWGQDLKRLSQWVESQGIDKIYVDYFGDDSRLGNSLPKYYLGEKAIPWYGSSWWRYGGDPGPGNFPRGNYLAVSATFLQIDRGKPRFDYVGYYWGYYNWLNDYQPIAQIGNSIFVYYIYD